MSLRLEDIERLHLGLLAVVVGLAAITGWLSAGSVLLGGGVMGVNFWLMRHLFQRLFIPDDSVRRTPLVVALVIAKFSIFMGLLALLFWRVPLDAISFAVGATLLLIACVVGVFRHQPALS